MLRNLKNSIANFVLRKRFVDLHVDRSIRGAFPKACRISERMPDDVYVVGFPKSGNTWMQHLVAGLKFGVSGPNAPGALIQELVPDVHYKRYYQRWHETMCFKSHELPNASYRRVVYLVRDGRDVIVSFKHFQQAIASKSLDLENLIDSPVFNFGSWAQHVRAWRDNPFTADLLQVRYEDLLRDGHAQLRKIAEFMSLSPDDAEISLVLEQNAFSALKAKEQRFGAGQRDWQASRSFFRKGKSGAYLEELPGALLEQFNSKHRALLEELEYL